MHTKLHCKSAKSRTKVSGLILSCCLSLFFTSCVLQDWKLKLNQSAKAVAIMSELWAATFANCKSPYDHPYGIFPPKEALMYIDRVCYRVPDRVSALHCCETNKKRCLQRSLTPHIDCCPHRMFQDIGEHKYSKWRPIQAFIALTGKSDIVMKAMLFINSLMAVEGKHICH